MSFIEVKNISKTFKVAKKESGLKGAFKSFFKREYKEIHATYENVILESLNIKEPTYTLSLKRKEE